MRNISNKTNRTKHYTASSYSNIHKKKTRTDKILTINSNTNIDNKKNKTKHYTQQGVSTK